MLRQEARIRRLAEAPEQRRRAFDVGEEKGQSSRGTNPKLNRQRIAAQRPANPITLWSGSHGMSPTSVTGQLLRAAHAFS